MFFWEQSGQQLQGKKLEVPLFSLLISLLKNIKAFE